MNWFGEGVAMAKKKATVRAVKEERVTLLNLKGSVKEKDYLTQLSHETGVPLSEIARRSIAMWATGRRQPVLEEWRGA
jgi:hypothetical protein